MTDEVPAAVVTGRKVSMVLLGVAMLVTALLVLWLVALWFTEPVVV